MFGDKLGRKYVLIKFIECTIQSCIDRLIPFFSSWQNLSFSVSLPTCISFVINE